MTTSLTLLFFGSFCMLITFNQINAILSEEDGKTLKLVTVLFRHGDRTPLPSAVFPTDEHADESYYPFGWANLNSAGKEAAFNLGMEIRERYNGFLPEQHYPLDIEAFTSNTSRTQMTLQCVLTAMYPPIWPHVFRPFLTWQPIAYQTLPSSTDTVIDPGANCKQIGNITTKMDAKLEELYALVSKNAGIEVTNSVGMMKVFNTIQVQNENGFDIPKWAEKIYNNGEFSKAANMVWQDIIDQRLPLAAGGFINKLREVSEYKIKDLLTQKMILFSGHDSTVSSVLGAVGAYDNESIEYTAHIYFELHLINGKYGFKIYYKNGPKKALKPIRLKGCNEDFCPIEKFIAATKELYIGKRQCD